MAYAELTPMHLMEREVLEGLNNLFTLQSADDPDEDAIHTQQRELKDICAEAINRADNREERIQQVSGYKTITRVYVAEGDPPENLPRYRDYRLTDFDGSKESLLKNPYACLDWLNKAFTVGEEANLSEEQMIQLLTKHTSGLAGRVVSRGSAEEKSLQRIVLDLETHFAGLANPIAAKAQVSRSERRPGETILACAERISYEAQVACRGDPDPKEAQLKLQQDAFLNALRPELSTPLLNKIQERLRAGEAFPVYSELAKEAAHMEEMYISTVKTYGLREKERRAVSNSSTLEHDSVNRVHETRPNKKKGDPWAPLLNSLTFGARKYGMIAQAHEDDTQEECETMSEGSDYTNLEDSESEFVGYTPQGNRRRRTTPRKSGKPAPRNKRGQFLPRGRKQTQFIRLCAEDGEVCDMDISESDVDSLSTDGTSEPEMILEVQGRQGGLIGITKNGGKRRIPYANLNVAPDECARCGGRGHRAIAEQEHCPLREFPLLTVPCKKCNKGGHDPKNCLADKGLQKRCDGRAAAIAAGLKPAYKPKN